MRAGFSLYLTFHIRRCVIKKRGAEFDIFSQPANKMGQTVQILG